MRTAGRHNTEADNEVRKTGEADTEVRKTG